jgi:hypothetical protein
MKTIANHSDLLKLGLQFFSEEEEAILPDDFEQGFDDSDLPQSEDLEETFKETQEETTESETEELSAEDEEQTEGMTEQEKEAFLKIKYNKEEIPLSEDEARELAQKGKNYDKLQEKVQQLESDPRLSFVENLAKEQNMTVDQYLQEVDKWKEQQRIEELKQQHGLSDELAQEMLENRKFREKIESERKAKEQEAKQSEEYGDFLQYFKQSNGRQFDPEKDADLLPQEVWQQHEAGVPLKFAYMEHQNNQLQSQLKTLKQNKENEKKAPGLGVTKHGSENVASEDPFLMGFNS